MTRRIAAMLWATLALVAVILLPDSLAPWIRGVVAQGTTTKMMAPSDLPSDAYLRADAAALFLGEWWIDRVHVEVDGLDGSIVREHTAGCEHWFVFGRPIPDEQQGIDHSAAYGTATGTVMRYGPNGAVLPEASIQIRAHSQNESEILAAGFVDEAEQAHGNEEAAFASVEHLPFLTHVDLKRTWYSKTRYASGRWQLSAEHGVYELFFTDNNHFSIHLHIEQERGSESAASRTTLILLGSRATTMEELSEMTGSSLKQYAPLILILVLIVLSRLVKSKVANAPRYKAPGSAPAPRPTRAAPKKSK